jgi:hypothetical protein
MLLSLRQEGCGAHESHLTNQTGDASSKSQQPPISSVKYEAICMLCLAVLVLVIVYFTALSQS